MIKRLVLIVILFSGVAISGNANKDRHSGLDDRSELWQQVEAANKKSLPKTAAGLLEQIYRSALDDKDYPEAVRALATKYHTEGQINQPTAPYVIRKLGRDVESFPSEIQPVMKAILASWFYSYFQDNRWRFAQRSQTNQAPGEDFETWDLSRLLAEIDRLFNDALANADELKTIDIQKYDELFEKGSVGNNHRPTLFDFIAFQALDFYSMDEQIIRKQGAFDVLADSPIFGNPSDFLNWKIDHDEGKSFLRRAVKLYKEVMAFHKDDTDKTAFLDASLHRLRFANSVAIGSEKTARYEAALRRFADENKENALSSMALYNFAVSLRSANDLARSHAIAQEAIVRHPDSVAAKMSFNLLKQIEALSLELSTERVWSKDAAEIQISYRNIDKVFFRIVKFDYENWRWGDLRQAESLRGDALAKINEKKVLKSWSEDLPATEDFKRRKETISCAADLEPGCYLLVASKNDDFSKDENVVAVSEIWKSKLAAVSRNSQGELKVAGQIFDAESGEPVANADVKLSYWMRDGRNSRSIDLVTLKSNKNGLFSVTGKPRVPHRILISKGDQVLGYIDGNYKSANRRRAKTHSQTVFFTDRSIYRPGQIIQFKGVCIQSNTDTNRYQTMPNHSVTVTLYDANNEQVEERIFTTNEFGSFSGSFNAPRNRITGVMRLQSNTPAWGNTNIRVEEYKRPKFSVEIKKPEQSFNLNEKVSIGGFAKAYTGAPIDGAKVSWRVVREVRYPDWWMWRCWWCPPANSESAEISNGETETKIDGSFNITFQAIPDLSVDREAEPIFTYSVYADVTDTAGETRSDSQQVRIGYTSLAASLDCKPWQTAGEKVELDLSTETLDGEPAAAKGVLKIYELKAPQQVQRAPLNSSTYHFQNFGSKMKPDLSKVESWPLGRLLRQVELKTDETGKVASKHELSTGAFKAVFETNDKTGRKVRAEKPFVVIDLKGKTFQVKVPNLLQAESWKVEVGETLTLFWGTGYDQGRAFIEFENRGKVFKSFWTDMDATQAIVKMDVDEKMRGGFQVRLTYVRDNRAYIESRKVDVPWSNKQLQVKWERFVSKLRPGAKETWTAVISGPKAERATAEFVAAMYDASLDAYSKLGWPGSFNVFYQDFSRLNVGFLNEQKYLRRIVSSIRVPHKSAESSYRHFRWNIAPPIFSGWVRDSGRLGVRGGFGGGGGAMFGNARQSSIAVTRMFNGQNFFAETESAIDAPMSVALDAAGERKQLHGLQQKSNSLGDSSVDLNKVALRKNLNETAFFFPKLTVDENGSVRIEFEAPEALTTWKILGFAHDNELRAALLTDEAVTSKDLMVQPNPPRFLREGDELEFSVKVSNQSAKRQIGKVRLSFSNAVDQQVMDEQLGNQDNERVFDIPAGQSKSFFWNLTVPDFVGVLTYNVVGGTERLSDGEEGFLPVLSKRILVTESLPLPIRGNQTRKFEFERLKMAEQSDSLISQTYTVQMASNPTWYAVMSLPYLMEYPHQCSEQVFNRLYANSIGRYIVSSDPRIERVFDQWRGTDALASPLEKNDDIRNVLIAESPWLKDAKKESQSRRDVGILFDKNRLDSETKRALDQLRQMQYSDGSWPWFPGGRANDYITLYVTTGFGRLRHLGVGIDVSPAVAALDRLDNWIHETHQQILKDGKPSDNHLTPMICLYFYGRSFFLRDRPVDRKYKAAIDYFRDQAKEYWPELGNRQSQGHLAIGLKRFGDLKTPVGIMKSLTERSKTDDELGMFWQENALSWWWYRAPIETQALLIEAYDEVLGDADKVEECKIWLLKQKQTQNWKTTKATADAIYALLVRGAEGLSSEKLVEVKLGGEVVRAEKAEAGTGFYQKRFVRGEIKTGMGQIEVSKKDAGIAWGSVHWQYLEDVGKIKPYEGTPLKVSKRLFIKKNTEKGPVIEPISKPVTVGDQLITRVEIRVDRDMEYVHLKDYRGSGTEPVNVLSRYRYQDGLAYYESTKDTASHFFIDYLPKGTYVFEYAVRIQHKGRYETGIAELQCMYAPEFNSHSNSVKIDVD